MFFHRPREGRRTGETAGLRNLADSKIALTQEGACIRETVTVHRRVGRFAKDQAVKRYEMSDGIICSERKFGNVQIVDRAGFDQTFGAVQTREYRTSARNGRARAAGDVFDQVGLQRTDVCEQGADSLTAGINRVFSATPARESQKVGTRPRTSSVCRGHGNRHRPLAGRETSTVDVPCLCRAGDHQACASTGHGQFVRRVCIADMDVGTPQNLTVASDRNGTLAGDAAVDGCKSRRECGGRLFLADSEDQPAPGAQGFVVSQWTAASRCHADGRQSQRIRSVRSGRSVEERTHRARRLLSWRAPVSTWRRA